MLIILRKSIFITVLSLLLAPWIAFASGQKEDKVTLGEFVGMLDQSLPENSLLPANRSQFSNKASILSSTNTGLSTGINGKINQTHESPSEKMVTELSAPDFMDDGFDTNIPTKTIFNFDDHGTLTISEDTIININNHVYKQDKNIRKAIDKQNFLTMNVDPDFDVNDFVHNPDQNLEETVITVSSGWARFKSKKEVKNGSLFKVVTPSATAGANGTEFLTIVDPQGKTTFLVLEGQIAAFSNQSEGNKGKLSLISAGEAQDFFPDGSHSTVRRLLQNF